jgi:capsular polysaccharide transport system ATP-binding protein
MIRLENVTKFFESRFGRHYVFRNVSLEIPDGVNVGVIGRNGAGKSTLLKLLSGADLPNEGRIVRSGNVSWVLGLTSGVQPTLTGAENARFACRILGVPVNEIPDKIAEIENFTEIGKFFRMPVNTYSSGMRGRLKFGIVMAFDYDVYLIDELTAVGDQAFKRKAARAFKEKRDRASFIKCTHNLSELVSDCDAGILLNEGKVTYHPRMKDAVRAYLQIEHTPNEAVTSQKIDSAPPVDTPDRASVRGARGGRRRRGRTMQIDSGEKAQTIPALKRPHSPAPMAPSLSVLSTERRSRFRSISDES